MERRVALVTHLGMNALAADDVPLLSELQAIGVASVVVSWDDPEVEWRQFDLVILRSCWNSHLKPTSFLSWLNHLEALGVPILNTAPLLKWNFSKVYLLDLAARGVAIPPTFYVDHRAEETLEHILARQRWSDAVFKPVVSASAYATTRVNLFTAALHEQEFLTLRRQGGVLVQEFIPQVIERGELSFVFLGGDFSHAVLKTVAPGDFRVQTDFGGDRRVARPDGKLIGQARNVLELAAPNAAYARVDAIEVEDHLILMELELVDPVLFFGFRPHSESILARLIANTGQRTDASKKAGL